MASTYSTGNVACTFGQFGGLSSFRLTDTRTDQLKVGLITDQSKRDAVVIRVTSSAAYNFTELAIVDGMVVVVCNTGQATYEIREPHQMVNDGQYHQIQFSRTGQYAKLQVDQQPPIQRNWEGYNPANYNQERIVYIGANGLDANGCPVRPFVGTLEGVALNGQLLLEMAANKDPRATSVGDVKQCQQAPAVILNPDNGRNECPVSGSGARLTASYVGPTYNTGNVAYTFGPPGGLFTVRLIDTQTDQLKVGLVTDRSNRDAVVIRVASSTGNNFVELAIVDGMVVVVCNTGQATYEIREPNKMVNDGQYHEIQFSWSGQYAELQVDQQPPIPHKLKGYDPANFNQERIVYIGANGLDVNGCFVRPFVGTLQGVVLNGKLLLEMAASHDARANSLGDVQQLPGGIAIAPISSPPPYKYEPPASLYCWQTVLACLVTWMCAFLFGLLAFLLILYARTQPEKQRRMLVHASVALSILGIIVGCAIALAVGIRVGLSVGRVSSTETGRPTVPPAPPTNVCPVFMFAGKCYSKRVTHTSSSSCIIYGNIADYDNAYNFCYYN